MIEEDNNLSINQTSQNKSSSINNFETKVNKNNDGLNYKALSNALNYILLFN